MILNVSIRARRDLVDIVSHLLTVVSRRRAHQIIDRIERRCETLVEMPERGRSIGAEALALRRVIEPPYVIIYEVRGELVSIVTILHGARDIDAELHRLSPAKPSD